VVARIHASPSLLAAFGPPWQRHRKPCGSSRPPSCAASPHRLPSVGRRRLSTRRQLCVLPHSACSASALTSRSASPHGVQRIRTHEHRIAASALGHLSHSHRINVIIDACFTAVIDSLSSLKSKHRCGLVVFPIIIEDSSKDHHRRFLTFLIDACCTTIIDSVSPFLHHHRMVSCSSCAVSSSIHIPSQLCHEGQSESRNSRRLCRARTAL
jgi:hypothetical protein